MKVIGLSYLTKEQIERTNAERFFRKLAAAPVKSYTQKAEEVKVKAKALIKQWGVQREQKADTKVVDIDDILKKADDKLNFALK